MYRDVDVGNKPILNKELRHIFTWCHKSVGRTAQKTTQVWKVIMNYNVLHPTFDWDSPALTEK